MPESIVCAGEYCGRLGTSPKSSVAVSPPHGGLFCCVPNMFDSLRVEVPLTT
jgi:hypothetical protein